MVWVLGLWPAFMNNNPLDDREDYVLQKRQAWVRAFIQEQLWLWKGEKKSSVTKIWGHSPWSGVYKSETHAAEKLGLTSALQMKFLFGFEPSSSILCLLLLLISGTESVSLLEPWIF